MTSRAGKTAADPPPSRRRDGRHRGRRAALQILYQWEVGRVPIDEAIEVFWRFEWPGQAPPSDTVRAFAAALARGTAAALPEADPLIEEAAEHWRLSRMAVLDRLILRMAVYEFLHTPETPRTVVINEALELAKAFSTDDAVKFINGLLDGIRKRLERESR